MDKAIKNHHEYVKKQLEAGYDADQLRRLATYHQLRVHDFQHERLVHLLVTLFFGLLVLIFTTGCLALLTVADLAGNTAFMLLSSVLCLLTFTVEIFYVLYYFRLENGLQQLYKLTDELFDKSK